MVDLTNFSSHEANMKDFLSAAHRRKYQRDNTIIFAGEDSDSIYYLIKGSVTVLIEDDSGHEIIIAYLNEGDFFGEMAMFNNGPRTAWVKAKTDCEVAEMGYRKFVEVSRNDPGMMLSLIHI